MALTSNKNYLQPTGFKIVIDRKNYGNLEYFAQSVTHPGSSVAPIELPVSRITSVPLAGDKIDYGELSIDIILDENMESYIEMQGWLERIVNEGQVDENRFNSSVIPTYADITVLILSSHNNKTVQIKYNDCVPVNLGSIALASNATDVSYLTFTTSFRFSSFEIS